ncbi:protein kinase [Actinomadura viridis]|uniref:protein kinase n=1 Tax=Actinomadura viridis TaxID=58110 RepID=UPI00368A1440
MKSLPGSGFEALVRPHTGDLTEIVPTARGNGSAFTGIIQCARGPFFVKAVPNRPGGRRDSLIREGQVNPHVQPIAPALRWRAEDEAWVALGFEVIDARRSDFTPGSSDLPAIVDILNRIAAVALPDIAHDWAETRWDRYAGADAELFRGDALLYTDIHESNLLIGDQTTWAVDWAWPTRGAAFIDPALLVVQLIAAGHSAEGAEDWASGCQDWKAADPRAVDAFAAATLRMWRERAERHDADWIKAMLAATQQWADHRSLAVA